MGIKLRRRLDLCDPWTLDSVVDRAVDRQAKGSKWTMEDVEIHRELVEEIRRYLLKEAGPAGLAPRASRAG